MQNLELKKFTAEAVQMSIINLGFCKKNLIITGF